MPLAGSSHAISQFSDAPPENLDAVVSPYGRSIFKKWLQRKCNKDPTSHEPNQLSRQSCQPADRRSPSHSPARVDDRHEGPSRMAVSVFPRWTIEWGVLNIS